VLPDVVKPARDFLKGHATMQALVDQRVHAHRTPKDYPLRLGDNARPWVVLTSIAETSVTTAPVDRTIDASVQLEGWGRWAGDHAHVRLIIATAHDLLRSQFSGYVDPDVKISAVRPDVPIQPVPDDEYGLARCMAGVRVIAYPLVAA
jgi:hypothetical protein